MPRKLIAAGSRGLVLYIAGLGGCSASDQESLDLAICRTGTAPQLVIGEGRGSYSPREDDELIGLVHGPQGGFHVEVGLQATYLDASEYLRGEIVVSIDHEARATARPWLDFVCTEDGLESFGTLLIFDGATPAELDGVTIEVEASVTDASGVRISAEKTLIIEDLG